MKPQRPEELLLDQVERMVAYWSGEIGNVPPELPLAERLDGLASSLLVMLDGDAINGGWRLAWIDENFVAQGGSESIAGTLHEQWAERKRGA